MRAFNSAIPLLLVLSLSATSVYAQTEDGFVPAEEGICDDLKGEGFPKALYGLCVAYCEAEARSEAVLTAYDRIRNRTDPPTGPAMPCDEPDECPCWSAELVTDRLLGGTIPLCGPPGDLENAIFLPAGGFELFEVDGTSAPTTCSYNIFPADPDLPAIDDRPINTVAQEEICRTDIDLLCGRLPAE